MEKENPKGCGRKSRTGCWCRKGGMSDWSSTPNVHGKQVIASLWKVSAITLVKKRQEKNPRALSKAIGGRQGNEEEVILLREADLCQTRG